LGSGGKPHRIISNATGCTVAGWWFCADHRRHVVGEDPRQRRHVVSRVVLGDLEEIPGNGGMLFPVSS
jgi:hypothetical protein